MRLKVANTVNNFRKNGREYKSKFVQPAQEIKEAKNFVRNNSDIVFTRADKGNTTVALPRTDYNDKVNNLLQDVNTYLVRPKDTTTKIENKVNTRLMMKNNASAEI